MLNEAAVVLNEAAVILNEAAVVLNEAAVILNEVKDLFARQGKHHSKTRDLFIKSRVFAGGA